MTGELVSVIVPCYNYGAFLPDIISSLVRQTYSNWECIVVDDGSTDGTREIVASIAQWDRRVRYIYQENKGISCARNLALGEAFGTLIQFVDADDIIEVEKFKEHVSFMARHPDTDIVYGDWVYFTDMGNDGVPLRIVPPYELWQPKTSGRGSEVCKDLITGNFLTISAPLVRKALLDRIHGFDEALRLHEDWDLWLRCAVAGGRFQYMEAPRTMTLIRLHSHSVSRDIAGMHRTAIEVRSKIKPHLSDQSLVALNTKLIGTARIHVGLDELKRGSLGAGCGQLLAGLRRGGSAELWKLFQARVCRASKGT